jgi:hypothetical protein
MLGTSDRTVRRYKEELGLVSPVNQYDNESFRLATFRKFLIKGQTEKSIKAKFGEHTATLLKHKFEGLNLFEQRDRYNQLVYILLPEFNQRLEVRPRTFQVSIAAPKHGLMEPYLLVSLPHFKGTINIAPLFDVHYGNKAHRHEKFLAYLRYIEETPNTYAILGGDLMENAIDDGRGMMYDQTVQPMNQLDELTLLLSKIAHKILCATTGNHEERTYKKTGIDASRVLCERLNIPYFDGPIFMSVGANTFTWNFNIFHGRGNSQTKGGKMNMAGRPRRFTNNIHFFVSGHVHDAVVESETAITLNPIRGELLYETQWTVVCQSFLDWADTYAYRAGYPPPSRGGVGITLHDNGDYSAHLT